MALLAEGVRFGEYPALDTPVSSFRKQKQLYTWTGNRGKFPLNKIPGAVSMSREVVLTTTWALKFIRVPTLGYLMPSGSNIIATT